MNNKDLITSILDWILDRFKAKNSKVYAVIMIILGGLYVLASWAVGNPDIHLPANVADTIQTLLVFLAALVGSHTPGSSGNTGQDFTKLGK